MFFISIIKNIIWFKYFNWSFQNYSFAVSRSALKGLGIGVALNTFAQFTGNLTITSYAVLLFEKAGTSLDPYVCSIMLGVALILGAIFSTYLADKLGRKFLNILSMMGSAVGLFAVSIYHYLNINGFDLSAFQWVPVVSLSFVIFISSAGIMALSIVCSVEHLPPKVIKLYVKHFLYYNKKKLSNYFYSIIYRFEHTELHSFTAQVIFQHLFLLKFCHTCWKLLICMDAWQSLELVVCWEQSLSTLL